MSIRRTVYRIHQWLGFIAGTVMLLSFSAAAVYVWEQELKSWWYADSLHAEAHGRAPLPLEELFDRATAAVPGKFVSGVEICREPRRAWIFHTYKKSEQPGWSCFSEPAYWDWIHVNPYSGEVKRVVDARFGWIEITRRLHQQLLLRYDVGHYIVGFATLILLVMIATGLVLWWPRNRHLLKQRLTIAWNSRWRRVNYDLHNVGGFYLHLLILVVATTGLVWTFEWWSNGITRLLGDNPALEHHHEVPALSGISVARPLDRALTDALSRRSTWQKLWLDVPGAWGGSSTEIICSLTFDEESAWDEGDEYVYHPETGMLSRTERFEDASVAGKWRMSNYGIHVGSVYGLPTKILATIVALFCAFLPITGVLIWFGRRNKPPSRPETGFA